VAAISITDLEPVGEGIDRPEQVLVTREGSVYASDKSSAVAEILREGGVRRIGHAEGEPNGIALTAEGKFLIANFGEGKLQELDPTTGAIRVLASETVEGRLLKWLNYVLVDSTGTIWCSVCTVNPDLTETLTNGAVDGYIFRISPSDGVPQVVADSVNFPNCMALDRDEEYLYVVRTAAGDVVRFRIEGDKLGPEEQYGPPLGERGAVVSGEFAAETDDLSAGVGMHMADGCGFDAEGNLWVTLIMANRIVAVTPEREVVSIAEDVEGALIRQPTSFAWGGADMRDVYIGSIATPYVLRGRSSIPGMPMVHQR
jgi:sugar lactone lactonase YvrE